MTTRIAVALAVLIAAAVAVDAVVTDAAGSLFLLQRLDGLLEWLAFWR